MQDGNPNGYYVMTFEGTRVEPKFIPAAGDPNRSMRIGLDPLPAGSHDADGNLVALNRGQLQPGTKLVVNLFDGGERDKVELSINGGNFTEMENILRNDPVLERLYERFSGTPDALAAPEPSSHIWEYSLPDMGAGLHVIRVRAQDEFGQKTARSFTFEITP